MALDFSKAKADGIKVYKSRATSGWIFVTFTAPAHFTLEQCMEEQRKIVAALAKGS